MMANTHSVYAERGMLVSIRIHASGLPPAAHVHLCRHKIIVITVASKTHFLHWFLNQLQVYVGLHHMHTVPTQKKVF